MVVKTYLGIVLGALPLVVSFVVPSSQLAKTISSAGSSSKAWRRAPTSLSYGPHDNSHSEDDQKASTSSPSPSLSSSSFENSFENQLQNQLGDPACEIDDEDCLAFSSLLEWSSTTNEDPLCDPADVDCQSFLFSKSHLGSQFHSDSSLAQELQTRSDSIQQERIDDNWKTAHCPTTFVPVSNSDWVRRVNMDNYPIAVCGGARGGLYVVNLEEKTIVAKVEGAHIVQVVDDSNNNHKTSSLMSLTSIGSGNKISSNMAKQAMEKLYGKLDGGGVVSVAISGDIAASSGREGGVGLWRIVKGHNVGSTSQQDFVGDDIYGWKNSSPGGEEEEGTATAKINDLGGQLVPLGSLPGLQNTIATSLKFDSNGVLWVACYDGTVRAYSMDGYDTAMAPFPPRKPLFYSDFTDSVLDMHLCEELKLGVCATADGGAALFNLEDGQFFVGLMLFQGAARSATIMKHKDDDGYSVLCGGDHGIIHRVPLNINAATGRVDEENPFLVGEETDTSIKPGHIGPVMTMASPRPGAFVSGGQDGALRVWDCSEAEVGSEVGNIFQTKCMYALTGYKLWLGSACTDGKRLISDGGESSIIVRDFSKESNSSGKASL